MTQEEKQLLLKDLCARLPYEVKVHTWYNKPMDVKCTGVDAYTNTVNLDISNDDDAKVYIENVKPYLRPMSSMTEREKNELNAILPCSMSFAYTTKEELIIYTDSEYDGDHYFSCFVEIQDWLNARHFDFRGLIEKGLALEAPEGMYKTE
jgi:hypothetical protein